MSGFANVMDTCENFLSRTEAIDIMACRCLLMEHLETEEIKRYTISCVHSILTSVDDVVDTSVLRETCLLSIIISLRN